MTAAIHNDTAEVVAKGDPFNIDHEDARALVKLWQPVKRKLEAQYRRWQDHEQHLWREAIQSTNTVAFLGLDHRPTLRRLGKYIAPGSIPLALLANLQLCPIRPDVADAYERGSQIDVTHWLHDQYRRYSIHVYDLGPSDHQYCIPLLDLTVVAGDDPLLFDRRAPDEASLILPPRTESCRLIVFPQTRYSFIEDRVFQSLFPLHEEQFKIMSYNLLQYFRGTAGYYNSLPNPFATRISQRSYDGEEIEYLAAMYPVIKLEFLKEYNARKISERNTYFMQRHGRNGFPAIAQARYSRRFDFPEEIQIRADTPFGGCGPERLQSGRALYEFACGEVDTVGLDECQTSVVEGHERNPSWPAHILVVEPLWILTFPDKGLLCVFQNETGDSTRGGPYKDIVHEKSIVQNWAKVLVGVIEKADDCLWRYEATYRTRLAKLRISIQTSSSIPPSLVKSLSDFVAEVEILLDPLQSQIKILQYYRQHVMETSSGEVATLDMFNDAIKVREEHLGSFQRLLDQGKNAQDLLFQLSNTECSHLQSDLARKMAHETEIQSDLAKRAQRQNHSILIFTVITVIFLPLSFFTSYFGMNSSDIRNSNTGQWFFWAVAAPISILIILLASFVAFRQPIKTWYRKLYRTHLVIPKEEVASDEEVL